MTKQLAAREKRGKRKRFGVSEPARSDQIGKSVEFKVKKKKSNDEEDEEERKEHKQRLEPSCLPAKGPLQTNPHLCVGASAVVAYFDQISRLGWWIGCPSRSDQPSLMVGLTFQGYSLPTKNFHKSQVASICKFGQTSLFFLFSLPSLSLSLSLSFLPKEREKRKNSEKSQVSVCVCRIPFFFPLSLGELFFMFALKPSGEITWHEAIRERLKQWEKREYRKSKVLIGIFFSISFPFCAVDPHRRRGLNSWKMSVRCEKEKVVSLLCSATTLSDGEKQRDWRRTDRSRLHSLFSLSLSLCLSRFWGFVLLVVCASTFPTGRPW